MLTVFEQLGAAQRSRPDSTRSAAVHLVADDRRRAASSSTVCCFFVAISRSRKASAVS